MLRSSRIEPQKAFIQDNQIPFMPARDLFIIVAVVMCFLPFDRIVPFFKSGSLAIVLTIFSFPFAMLHLTRKTEGSWCYYSILLVAIGEVAFTKNYDLPFITIICASLGPMFVIIAAIVTRKDLDRTMNIVILAIFISVCFSILTYFVGEPFISIRNWLRLNETETLKETYDNSLFQGEAGLRGSIYMFGYDLTFLIAFLIGGIIINMRKKLTGSILFFVILAAITVLSIYINKQRTTLLVIAALSLISLLLFKKKLHFFILALVISVSMGGFLSVNTDNLENLSSRLEGSKIEDASKFRFYLIEIALYSLKVQPLAPKSIYDELAPEFLGEPMPPHVHFLTILIKYSILALPFVFYLIWKLVGSIVNVLRFSDNRSMIMLAFGMVASLIYGLTHNPGPWGMTPSGVLLLTLYGKGLDLRFLYEKNGNKT